MTEQQIIAWLTAHPFARLEIIAILAGVSAMAKADWSAFTRYKVTDPHATWDIRVAAKQYLQGIVIGGVPPVVAKIWQILGG